MRLPIFLTLPLLFSSPILVARTHWVKKAATERTCADTCSRDGSEDVMAPRNEGSVCAIEYLDEKYPGNSKGDTENGCRARVGMEKKFILDATAAVHCLCADDGANRGADYAWIHSPGPTKDCTEICSQTSPKYTYAVYGSFHDHKKNWMQVCANANGVVGFKNEHSSETCTENSANEPFGCLCTQMFSGDLDQLKDP